MKQILVVEDNINVGNVIAVMPSIPGDEVARRLRAMHPATRTLLLTGYAEFLTVDSSAVDAQMAKPFAPELLRDTVRRLIGSPATFD